MTNTTKPRFPNLGYFIEFRFWEDAIRLLKYQLNMKLTNKHFNTPSLFYYEKLLNKIDNSEHQDYFANNIFNNLFYGLKKEYWVIPYTIPKANLGLRKYKFFSFLMRLVYYAIGLYLVQLSQKFLSDYYTKYGKHIYSKYGGHLRFDEKTKHLILSYDNFWYKPHYQAFRNRVIKLTELNPEKQIVIHLDIQNYYDDIDVATLLKLLEGFIEPTVKQALSFDAVSQGQIESFLNYVQGNRLGIPQSDNDIISSFIGHLYLVLADLFIEQEVQLYNGVIEDYHIIRYMDDYYISLTIKDGTSQLEKEKYVNTISAHIADILYKRLGLRLNTKTRWYWLDQDEERIELLKNLKRVSPEYEGEFDDEKTEKPEKKLKRILAQIKKLKDSPLDKSFRLQRDLDTEILKDIYVDSVQELLKKPENIKKLDKLFEGFNFDLVIAYPREIVIILLNSNSATTAFQDYLLKKNNLSTIDAFLILSFLCQTNFQSMDLINRLKGFDQFLQIMGKYEVGEFNLKYPGYFELSDDQISKMTTWDNVIEQIRLRAFAEQRQQYSVALSHLLNEIHAIVWHLDPKKKDQAKYNANDVLDFLDSAGAPHEVRIKIRNLFDRRNKTPISHADTASWHVSELEYVDYREEVGKCLRFLL